jgi:transcriptional regulator with XRE-family HTH domain
MAKKLAPIEKRIAKNLCALRARAGMTQTAVARMAGLHLRYVQDIEAGRRNPTVGVAERLKNGFGCEWEDLLNG